MNKTIIKNDFDKIRNWVFDLDDTLYPPSDEIYAQMAWRIRNYIMRVAHVDEAKAAEVQKEYYRKYGATVHGLIVDYNIDPADFTDYVHQLDLSSLKPNPDLIRCLSRLSGNKFVFTNGAHQHAERVLKRLEISDFFSGIFSITEADYVPKPALQTYQKMLETFHISPSESVMFDDNQKNVLGAKKAGMKTVWISSNTSNNKYCMADTPDFCDYETPDLIDFLSSILMDKSA